MKKQRRTYTPTNCPWAALVDGGHITPQQASRFRNDKERPGRESLEEWSLVGWTWSIFRGRLVCDKWPGKRGF